MGAFQRFVLLCMDFVVGKLIVVEWLILLVLALEIGSVQFGDSLYFELIVVLTSVVPFQQQFWHLTLLGLDF